jgi:tetratricopeptide (TPR) repeat protein
MASHKKIQEDPKLLETVQMFEVITAANPDDYQSMEILKEAYTKLGRERDAIEASKKIAKIYVRLGQISSAILEYEGVLQRSPDDGEALAALGELESKMPGYAAVAEIQPEPEPEPVDAQAEEEENPNELLVDFMIQHGLFPEKNRTMVLSAFASKVAESHTNMPSPTIIEILAERAVSAVENTLLFLTQTAKIPFLPMDTYDIDPRRAEIVDPALCVARMVLPFDQMSRTVFAATANPMDRHAKHQIESAAQCHVQWYITRPNDLRLKIKDVFRLLS